MKRTSGILSAAIVVVLLVVTASTRAASTATYIVTTTANSGAGSLRQAILDANANPGLDTIAFAIGSIGSQQTISTTASLPTISEAIFIDGWSQGGSGYTGPPLIEINGSGITTWNTSDGLRITAGNSIVRGLAINYFDIAINLESAGNNVIAGNYLGLALDGVTPIGNRTGMRIESTSDNNRIGTNGDEINDTAERNVISASGFVQQNNSTGILIDQGSDTNWIAGNFIGTDATGTQDRGNASSGITTGGVTIIGTNGDGVGDDVEGNLISGNNSHGVALATTSSGSRVAGNQIGTDLAGAIAIPNNSNGVSIGSCSPGQCSNYIIGTNGDGVSDALEGNLISGNGAGGVFIPAGTLDNNVIAGNKIGTNLGGTAALPNGDYGVQLGGDFSRLGTNNDGVSDDLEGNLISGNGDGAGNDNHGVVIPGGSDHNRIAGNKIGTNAAGTATIPNGQTGLRVEDDYNTIAGNLISGNGEHGITFFDAFFNMVTDNLIGTTIDGVTPLSNTLHGVYIAVNSDDNTIGAGNAIAFNSGDGVFVDNNCGAGLCLRNTIAGNRIFANGGLGIDLFPNGVTLNDPTDADTGANNLQNFPVITAVDNPSGMLIAAGTLTSTANTTYTLYFYSNVACDVTGYGEGQTYLGAITTTTDLAGFVSFTATLPISVPAGESITATATDPTGNTSEFSTCSSPIGYAPISGLQAFNDSPTYLGSPTHFTATVTAGSGISYAWNFGDGFTGSGATIAHSYNSIGTYTAVVTATNSGSSAVASTIVTITQRPACAATPDDGLTVFSSVDASALQQAVDTPQAAGGMVKIAGTCAGVSTRAGLTQTVYIEGMMTLAGGYTVGNWATPDPGNPSVLDALGLGRVIYAFGAPLALENLTIQNGSVDGEGGGLVTWGNVILLNVTLQNNQANRGGGAYVGGTLQALDSNWLNNTGTTQRGGGLEVYSDATITGGLVQGNKAAYSGGFFADAGLVISGTQFISNTATSVAAGSGGAIYSSGPLEIAHALFEGNQSYAGGGAIVHSPGVLGEFLSISNTAFLHNTVLNALAQGGALNTSAESTIIHASLFEGNHAPGSSGNGGAIVAYRSITLTETTLISNTAGNHGGAIYHWGLSVSGNTSQIHPLIISSTSLLNNSASGEGGALYFRRGFAATNVPVRIDHTSFLSNTSILSGGAVYLGQPAAIADSTLFSNASSAAGGGLFAEDALEMTRTTVQGNTANRAGGAYLKGTLAAIDTTWRNNQCPTQRGGAFEVYGTASLIGGWLEGNRCRYAGGIFADAALTISGTHFISNIATNPGVGSGGAIYSDAALTITNARFERNTSYTGGGAVLHSGTELLAITSTTFISNTALNAAAQGGALNDIGALATIHDSVFQGNHAPGEGGAIVGHQAMTLSHVSLIANTAGNHGGAIYHWGLNETGSITLVHPLVIADTELLNNSAGGEGGALYFRRGFGATNVPVQLKRASFLSNTAILSGGAVYLGQPGLIARGEFRGNASAVSGGGVFAQDAVNVAGVTFAHNTAATNGGAIAVAAQPGSINRVENSVFANNQAAGHGAGLAISSGKSIEIVHSTLAGGSLNSKQAIYAAGTAVHITNTIIASHTVGIERGNLTTVTAERNLFFGNTLNTIGGVTNTNPIGGDPRFIDPASDDYHLSLGSTALDVGVILDLGADFEDDLRFIGLGVDVGADEFGDAAVISSTQTTQIGVQPRPGQQISITIPPGASGGTGIIRLLPIITPTRPLPPRRPYANLGFTLQTQSGGGLRLADAETFSTPITIELQYTDADVAGMNEAALDLLVWDEIGQAWITAQATCASPMSPVRQIASNRLIVLTCAEGEFALTGGPYQLYLPVIFNNP